ncbi:MAG: PAS domain S-box protein, partial [Acidobacteria bacterium]|nr:PAS domain S-box protein [Acidobacteriota bacterium]
MPGQVPELGAPNISNYETEQFGAHRQNWTAVQDRRGVMYFGNTNGILEFDGQRWQFIPVLENAVTRALTCGPDGTIYYGSIGDFGYLAVSPSGKVSAVSLKEAIPQADRAFNDVWQAFSSRHGVYFLTRSKIFRLVNGEVHSIQGKFASSQACLLNETLFYADMDKGLCMLDGDQAVPIPQLGGVYNGNYITLALFGRHEMLVGRMSGDFLRIDLSAFWDEASQRYDVTRQAPKDIVKTFPSELDDFIKESNGFLYKLIPIDSAAFAISTIKGGIVTFNRAGKIIQVINIKNGLLDNSVTDLFMDRPHNLWAATNSGISHIELSVPQSFFGAQNNINGVSISASFHGGRLYVGTYQGMLVREPYRFALQNDKQVFRTLKDSPTQVWQFLEVDGDLMAATAKGLFRIQGEEAIKVQGSVSYAYSLATSKSWPNHLFVGLREGIEVFKHKTGPGLKGAARWEFLGRMEDVKDNIRAIAEDTNGDLWAGTEAKGLLRIHFSGDKPSQAAIHRFGPEQGLPGLSGLRAMSRDTTLFVVSPKGLFRTTIAKGDIQAPEQIRFIPDTILGKSFLNPPVALNIMIFDQKGSAFFSTSDGVFWAIPQNDGHYRMEIRPFRGIPAPEDSMYLHSDGRLWLPGKELYRVDLNAPKDYDQPFNVLVRKVVAKSKRLVFEGTHGRPGSAFGEQRTVFEGGQDPLETPELPFHENALSFEFSAAFYEKPGTTQFQYLLEGFDRGWSEWTDKTSKEYTNLPEGRYSFRVRAKNLYGTMGHEAVYSLRILPPWYRTWWAYILWIIGGGAALVGIIYLYTLKLRRQKDHLKNIVAERTKELEKLSIVARETDNAVIIMDEKANIEWINQGFTHLYGLTLEELFQINGSNLITASLNPDIKQVIEKCIRDKKSVSYESTFETKWSQKICSQTTLTPILDDKGNIKKLISIDSDITGRKIAEEKIKNLLAEKELILKEVHHRIKNNMATVMGLFSLQAST